jgi:hypothetical protein
MCTKINSFWVQIGKCICQIQECNIFKISLDKIICGWHIQDRDYNLANLLIILASFSIYKTRMIYNETKKFVPISSLFILEMKKIDQIISKTTKKLRICIDPEKWLSCKTYWNII